MTSQQLKEFNRIVDIQKEETNAWIQYWHKYSYFNDWHFWAIVALFIFPLIALYFLIDRRRIFHISFYGFNIHVWNTYSDIIGVQAGKWNYPYKVIPLLPIGFSLDLSFVPVVFMLVYQWTLNRTKDFYLYAVIPSAFFAFIVKPIMKVLDLTRAGREVGGWKGYFSLFITYVLIAYVSKWITDLFRRYHEIITPIENEQMNKQRSIHATQFLGWFRRRRKVR